VENISRDPNDVPPSVVYGENGMIEVNLTTTEVIAELADGATMNYWTFDNAVPGPFIRGKVGDTVHLTIRNDPTSLHPHNVDFPRRHRSPAEARRLPSSPPVVPKRSLSNCSTPASTSTTARSATPACT
jgi:FtsP/CotA-like multicopper oxidase with cupredoxin domain